MTAPDDDAGALLGFAKVTSDTTTSRIPEETLRQSDQRLEILIDSIRDYAIFMLSPEGTVLSWNQGAQRLKGYAADGIIGQTFERFYTDEAREQGRPQYLLAIARAEGRVEDEGWRVRSDGSRFWADVVITALHDHTGNLIGFAKVTRDLTARRASEEQLRLSEQRFRTLVNSVKDYAIFMLSPEGTVMTWNQGAQELKGYLPGEIIGQSFERFYTREDCVAGRPQLLLATAESDGRVEDEGWRIRKDGSRFWADVVITVLRDDAGTLIGYAKVTRDLTERRQAEQERAARLAAERATRRVERLQGATAALAAATRVQEAAAVLSDVAMQLVGASASLVVVADPTDSVLDILEVCGYPGHGLAPKQHQVDAPFPLSHAYGTGRALFLESRTHVRTEHPELMAGLEYSPFNAWVSIPLSIDRKVFGVLGLSFLEPRALDSDERGFLLALGEVGAQALDRARVYELEQLAREEAVSALRTRDEFLSVAAHELRTPVAAVKATAQLAERALLRGHFDVERTTGHLKSIARSADRLDALIEDLLDVSRLRTGRLELRRALLDPGQIVQEIVSRYGSTYEQHQFQLNAPRTATQVCADALRLEQVLDNLLSNAVKYSPDGGAVEVAFGPEAHGVLFTVKDQGIGLSAGQEERIFDAFGRGSNATARQIQGLGLGLAICREIADGHGGRIWAQSPGEGRGTTLSLWLPGSGYGDCNNNLADA